MIRPRFIIITTFLLWLIVGGVVIRTNRLLIGPVTFRWPNLTQPSAMFRWTTALVGQTVIIPENSIRSFKVVGPKKFTSGELIIATTPGQGVLTVNINAPVGKTNTTGSTPAGGSITLPLQWDSIAVQTRTFNVELLTDTHEMQIQSVTLKLQ